MKHDYFSRVIKLLDDLATDWKEITSIMPMPSEQLKELEALLRYFSQKAKQSNDITEIVAEVGSTLPGIAVIKGYSLAKFMKDARKEEEAGTYCPPTDTGFDHRITDPKEIALFVSKLEELHDTISGKKKSSFLE